LSAQLDAVATEPEIPASVATWPFVSAPQIIFVASSGPAVAELGGFETVLFEAAVGTVAVLAQPAKASKANADSGRRIRTAIAQNSDRQSLET